MSIDLTIKQKGLFKKTLPIEIILGKKLAYGTFDDGWRLTEGETGENDFIAFLPDAIARGFSVTWYPKDKDSVDMRLLTPTSEEEIIEFYACVGRIMDYWNAVLEVEGEKIRYSKWLEGQQSFIEFNARALRDMCQNVIDGKHDALTLFSAQFPLNVGADEAKVFVKDITAFEEWMHEKQSMDVYYAKPSFFRADEKVIGRYVLSENIRSVYPKEPEVPFGFNDPETGKALKCDEFKISFYNSTEREILGETDYEEFIAKLPPEKVSRFDGKTILVEGLELSEIEAMLGSEEGAQ